MKELLICDYADEVLDGDPAERPRRLLVTAIHRAMDKGLCGIALVVRPEMNALFIGGYGSYTSIEELYDLGLPPVPEELGSSMWDVFTDSVTGVEPVAPPTLVLTAFHPTLGSIELTMIWWEFGLLRFEWDSNLVESRALSALSPLEFSQEAVDAAGIPPPDPIILFGDPRQIQEIDYNQLRPLVRKGENRDEVLRRVVEGWCAPASEGVEDSDYNGHYRTGGFYLDRVRFWDENTGRPIDFGELLRMVEARLNGDSESSAFKPRPDLFIMMRYCRIDQCNARGLMVRPTLVAHGVLLGDDADFSGSIFGEVCCDYSTFGKGANFGNTVFERTPAFMNCRFGHGANFEGATFADYAFFWDTEFGDYASFRHATSGNSPVHFRRAKFGRWANFDGCCFGKGTDFSEACFGDSASFRSAVFGNRTSFHETSFRNRAFFENAVFGRMPDFEGARRTGWRRMLNPRDPWDGIG